MVAPLAGAWIEMLKYPATNSAKTIVAPLAGAWIEIVLYGQRDLDIVSLPSRERGLKFTNLAKPTAAVAVAPLAGAWIEISLHSAFRSAQFRRSPRGSVD